MNERADIGAVVGKENTEQIHEKKVEFKGKDKKVAKDLEMSFFFINFAS